MKIRKLLLVLCLSIGIGIFASSISAQASSWHKGIPNSLKGTFQSKSKFGSNHKGQIAFAHNKVSLWDSVDPYVLASKVHYKKLNHNEYYFVGTPDAQGVTGGKSIFTIKKHGHNKLNLHIKEIYDPISHKKESKKLLDSGSHGLYYRIKSNNLISMT